MNEDRAAPQDGGFENVPAALNEACRTGEPPGGEGGPLQPELFAAPEAQAPPDRDAEAAYKADREIDRLRGFLRFRPVSPGSGGPVVYTARCAPDHHVLPGLAEHFTRRFGECPWAIIDEKRGLVLAREPGGEARLFPLNSNPVPDRAAEGRAGHRPPDNFSDNGNPPDYYEDLWRNYHRSINNPDRNNPALQRQFIPRRYWKYLTEFQ